MLLIEMHRCAFAANRPEKCAVGVLNDGPFNSALQQFTSSIRCGLG